MKPMARKRRVPHKSSASDSGVKSEKAKQCKNCFVKLKRMNKSDLQGSAKCKTAMSLESGRTSLTQKIDETENPNAEESEIMNSSVKIETPKKSYGTNLDDIYELQISQPSASETEDMTLFKKLAKEGKVQIKHKRKNKNISNIKKKYVNPSKIWSKVEKNIGIRSSNQKIKSKVENATVTEDGTDKNSLNKKYRNDNNKAEQSASFTSNKSLTTEIENIVEPLEPSSDSSISPIKKVHAIRESRTQLKDKKKLLEFAKKYVSQSQSSTPITNKHKKASSSVVLSPILPASPWQKSKASTFLPDEFISDFGDVTTKNLSNAENIPPESIKRQQNQTATSIINSTITTPIRDNKLKMSNSNVVPVTKRGPLKEINVLEVVHLPPLPLRPRRVGELSSILNQKKQDTDEIIPIEDYNQKSDTTNSTVADFFGFGEIEEIEPDEGNTTVIPAKANLKRKLRSLKKLLPPHEQRLHNTRQQDKIPSLFGESTSKQANIRKMLNSTMVNSSNTTAGKVKDDEIVIDKDDISLDESTIVKETNNDSVVTVDLFDDPYDPETTLDTTKIKKTYSRHRARPKRYFLFFSDEESDHEAEAEGRTKRRRKKQDKDQNNEKELNQFAEEFNSMCEEAENYELVTEIETSTLDV